MSTKATKCGGCAKTVGKPSVQCTNCDLWYHLACGDINEDMFKLINSTFEAYGRHVWACRSCLSAISSLNKKINKIEAQYTVLQKAVDTNTEAIKEVDKDVKKLRVELDSVKESANGETVSNDVFSELNERESRKLNLVIHSIPEPTSESAELRKKEDSNVLDGILRVFNVDGSVDNDVKFMYRAGKKPDNPEHNRPLIVGFRDRQAVDFIINNGRLLKNSPYSHISVVPDLTPRQRQEEDNMKAEVDKKNEEMTEEEAGNWTYKMLGPKGQRKIVKARIYQEPYPRRTRQNGNDNNTDSNNRVQRSRRGRT